MSLRLRDCQYLCMVPMAAATATATVTENSLSVRLFTLPFAQLHEDRGSKSTGNSSGRRWDQERVCIFVVD